MATRSRIALVRRDGTVCSIYSHWGGPPNENGVILRDHYGSFAQVQALVALGSSSVLDEHLEPPADVKHAFGNRCPGVTLAYHRDRKDAIDITEHTDLEALLHHKGCWEEYLYVFDDGQWWAYDTHGPMPLPVEIPATERSESKATSSSPTRTRPPVAPLTPCAEEWRSAGSMQLLGSSATTRPSKMQPDKDDKLRVIDPSDSMWEELEGMSLEEKLARWPPKTKPLPTLTTRPAPSRTDFSTDAECEESMSRWQSTVGRNKAIEERALLDFRLKSKSTGKESP